jgi:hypothetical protein
VSGETGLLDENKQMEILYNMYKVHKRIEWLNHIQRMTRERGVKRIFEDKPGGRRRVGRPRLRWVDGVESDLRTMRVKIWRNIATEREARRRNVREASALHGP